jgi:hypothetical protein
LEQAQLKRSAARADSTSAGNTFNNWLATRRATQLPEQDNELIAGIRASGKPQGNLRENAFARFFRLC